MCAWGEGYPLFKKGDQNNINVLYCCNTGLTSCCPLAQGSEAGFFEHGNEHPIHWGSYGEENNFQHWNKRWYHLKHGFFVVSIHEKSRWQCYINEGAYLPYNYGFSDTGRTHQQLQSENSFLPWSTLTHTKIPTRNLPVSSGAYFRSTIYAAYGPTTGLFVRSRQWQQRVYSCVIAKNTERLHSKTRIQEPEGRFHVAVKAHKKVCHL